MEPLLSLLASSLLLNTLRTSAFYCFDATPPMNSTVLPIDSFRVLVLIQSWIIFTSNYKRSISSLDSYSKKAQEVIFKASQQNSIKLYFRRRTGTESAGPWRVINMKNWCSFNEFTGSMGGPGSFMQQATGFSCNSLAERTEQNCT